MASFNYEAINNEGKKIKGKYDAQSKKQVIDILKEKALYPVKIEEAVERKEISFDFLQKVKTKDLAIFCRQFQVMLNAGVSIINCIDILRFQTENKKLRNVVKDVYEELQKGQTFSEALKIHDNIFPELFIYMVEAGEVSGTLDIILERMAVHYEKENKIQNKVKGAMVYPIILSVISVGIIIFLLVFVMPTFIGMFQGSGVELPLPTRILLLISNAIKSFWYIIISILSIIIFILNRFTKTIRGKYIIDRIKLKLPIIGSTTKKIVTSRFTRTLSTLLGSGIPLIQALEVVAKIVQNKIVEDGLLIAKEDIRKGVDLASPIKKIGFFPPMVESMIKIGEDSGALDEILDKTANFYDDEVEVSLQKLVTMLEPMMIVFMAIIVGGIVMAMILPMFNMINTLSL